MYNGIGLPTARGSGTNGYVQKNLSHVSKRRQLRPDIVSQPDPNINKGPNKEILLHQRKREIESKCYRLKLELEEEGLTNSEIEKEVDAYRRRKLSELEREFARDYGDDKEEEEKASEDKSETKTKTTD